jgi:cbb3-type cytochrome c oxidase subunit III
VAGRRAGLLGVSLLLAVLGGGCGSEGLTEEGSASRGQQLFADACGQCHTLRSAGTQGTIGPNLDDAFAQARKDGVGESTIREVVRRQIEFPVPADVSVDVPPMPADLVEGEDADSVAVYVASVAANPDAPVAAPPPPPPPAGGGGGGGEIDAEGIFSSSCASCHTLEAAGASGTIGPNLDESQPDEALAVERITNGMGVMPAFRGQLSEQEIAAVARYVAENSGQ